MKDYAICLMGSYRLAKELKIFVFECFTKFGDFVDNLLRKEGTGWGTPMLDKDFLSQCRIDIGLAFLYKYSLTHYQITKFRI